MKKLFVCLVVVLLLATGGCGNSVNDTEAVDNTSSGETEVRDKTPQAQVVKDFFAAWNEGDSALMGSMVFQGYGYTDIAGDITTTESITLTGLEDISEAEGAVEGEMIYKAAFEATFSDDGAASGFVNGENTVKLLLLYDDEHLQWLITQWEKC